MEINDSLCRFCLQTTENMVDIFSSDINYIEEVENLTGIKIIREYEFPSFVCEECRKIIVILRNFRDRCKRSEELLQQVYKAQVAEPVHPKDGTETITENVPISELNLHNENIRGTNEVEKSEEASKIANSSIRNSAEVERKFSKHLIACHICGKQYESCRLQYHLNKHTGARPYKCSYENCGKSFPSPFLLKSHTKVCHTDNYPFTCDICGRQFKVRTTFLIHRSYHLDPEIPCSVCNKLLRNKRALKKHMMSHTGERPFPCNTCEKSFQNKYTLKVHQRVHTKEKPFLCTKCDKSFGYNCLLKMHIGKEHPDPEQG